jgi:hypothetical protein
MNIAWFVISTLSLCVIVVTMLCRANDLRWRRGLKWQVRLVGFVLCGSAPIGVIGVEWLTRTWPTPYEAIFRLGLAFVFVTTPYLPPWWRWISGKEDSDGTN